MHVFHFRVVELCATRQQNEQGSRKISKLRPTLKKTQNPRNQRKNCQLSINSHQQPKPRPHFPQWG